MTRKYLFSSESVTEGHPDKVADQISDAVLDAILAKDPEARVACETMVTTGLILIAGEITTSCYVDLKKIARETVKDIGYTRAKYGFDGETCAVLTAIDEQSGDIALGVDHSLEEKEGSSNSDLGAGDQGLMFGYASNETEELMPLPIMLSHKLARRLAEVRKNGPLKYLRPDGKTQVTIAYKDNKPIYVDKILISSQHHPKVTQKQIKEDITKHVIKEIIDEKLFREDTEIFVNPTGRFVIGGPNGDTGLTGRKIIVDTYGGTAHHGGGAFSGKDPTKVDRSASYAARYIAKNIVAADLAARCEVQMAYAIGVAKPLSVMIDTFGTAVIDENKLEKIVKNEFDLRPAQIIKNLNLRKPIYKQVAAYGHFGRHDLDLPWEKIDRVDSLRKKAGLE
ncbi:MAG: S-adenosylmethionine synthetase [Halanaerobium sp. 4-GBenrich]|uniref:S-adenosylmethionine synthase n=1 Tax=Halanaerobium congolense TaxID=54121 RepID=A0A1G6HR30_9FIRM|nr:methionine adenosyltransferase [Halanaerobium congolense]ODS49725.1 MAG: S-adenosylmethionine synthetase [Halanaerobium sp. 4-GBenrich]TDX48159.1 methionine adenosyltransferase [Halanaerobium congolense]SDB95946.1 methionine adenosyltransferase [Halanaerobium congolense]SDH33733.1 methionine adenosyltransferase [Halanaerobium congolense]SDK34037.1 methionine adenosyltransferase [Halanaerobium congolense]